MAALRPLVAFILIMWGFIIVGGGILVLLVAPINIECCGEYGRLISSGVKVVITLLLVVLWVKILSWLKRTILHRMIHIQDSS